VLRLRLSLLHYYIYQYFVISPASRVYSLTYDYSDRGAYLPEVVPYYCSGVVGAIIIIYCRSVSLLAAGDHIVLLHVLQQQGMPNML
jgi:hypothetical protein